MIILKKQISPSNKLLFLLTFLLTFDSPVRALDGYASLRPQKNLHHQAYKRDNRNRLIERYCAADAREERSDVSGTVSKEGWADNLQQTETDPIGMQSVLQGTDQVVQNFLSQGTDSNVVSGGVGVKSSMAATHAKDVMKLAQEAAQEHNLISDDRSVLDDVATQVEMAPLNTKKGKKAYKLPEIPTTKELIKFVLPTIGMIQAPAIMSVVDTAVVGRSSSLELAALSPSSQMCDACTFIFSFLGMSTSNLVARAIAENDEEELQKTVSHSFAMAIGIGVFIFSIIQLFGKSYMSLCIGPKAMQVLPPALRYARWRVFGSTAIMLTMVGQATSLGMKDSLTPLMVIVLNATINLFGDIFLVTKIGMGILGAAIATALAECCGAVLMINSIRKKFKNRTYPFIKAPSFPEFKKFMGTGGPLFFMLWSRSVSFAWLAQTISSAGTVPLGAYQILLRVAFILTGFGDGLSLAAQSFLPSYNLRSATDPKAHRGKLILVGKIMALALGLGVFMCAAGAFIPLKLGFLFTKDVLVLAEMKKTVPVLMGILMTYAISLPMEGILISMQDGAYMAKIYGALLLVKVAYLEMVKRVPFFSKELALSAWAGLLLYNIGRATCFATRFFVNAAKERRSLANLKTKQQETAILLEKECSSISAT